MREIIHLPLGRTPEEHDWASDELNDLYAAYPTVDVIGVYVDAMDYSARPVMVVIVGTEESE